MGEAILYKLINCKNWELLLKLLANSQSIYKYFSQNPVSPFISSHKLTTSLISKSLKLIFIM